MHLGVYVIGTGNHIAGWRYPGAADSFENLSVMQEIAAIAERGCFDLLFLGDSMVYEPGGHPSFNARFEPLTILSALAVTTTHIGLGATASTSYSEPFPLARAFASLDHISAGRAAWNAVTSSRPGVGVNFGREHPPHSQRYEIAEEFVDVVSGLWDCWDDDALVINHTTGQYIDHARVRSLDHVGKHFAVKGPLNISRSPQGRPVIIQAGSSGPGQRLAARTADAVFTVVQNLEDATKATHAFKALLPRYNRSPSDVTVLPGVMPILGRTRAEATEKLNHLQSFVTDAEALPMLSQRIGHDMSGYDLDAPVPDLDIPDTSHGFSAALLAKARREGLLLRDLYNLTAAARGHLVITGTPEDIADTLENWFSAGAADGFNILPPYFPGAFADFIDQVVPILQHRGLFRREYSGRTLRDHLGLKRPGPASEDNRSSNRNPR
jgi:FMN-dependent oxidoreductase (nitrilotriacetate monooxygenase family)